VLYSKVPKPSLLHPSFCSTLSLQCSTNSLVPPGVEGAGEGASIDLQRSCGALKQICKVGAPIECIYSPTPPPLHAPPKGVESVQHFSAICTLEGVCPDASRIAFLRADKGHRKRGGTRCEVNEWKGWPMGYPGVLLSLLNYRFVDTFVDSVVIRLSRDMSL
jgi:hypothetical protein